MSDLKKENVVNREPADMHSGDGIRFTEDQKARKERKENHNLTVDKNLKEDETDKRKSAN